MSDRKPGRPRLQVGVAFQAAPEVPTGYRAVGAPAAGHPLHFVSGGEGFQIVGFADGVADAQVARGQDVGPLQGEDQEHVSGPDADAFDLGEAEDDLVVGQSGEIREHQLPLAGMAGGGAGGGGLFGGGAEGGHTRGGGVEGGFGGGGQTDG